MKTITGLDGYREMAGQPLGESDWREVSQEQVNSFADATGDHQWIHVDVERARQGPFKGTIAHGFLTLALIPALSTEILSVEGIRMGINYGLNRVRFPAPVPVGSRVRASVRNLTVEPVSGGIQVVNEVTISVEGQDKPACVAETVTRLYD
jgi:acyl dehydratase